MARPKKETILDDMTTIQIYEVIKSSKTMKIAAQNLGVSLADLNAYKYNPANKKALDALKKADQKKQADLEMGIEIEEEPAVQKTQARPKGTAASQIPVTNMIVKEEHERITRELQSTLDAEKKKNERLEMMVEDQGKLVREATVRADRMEEKIEKLKSRVQKSESAETELNDCTKEFKRTIDDYKRKLSKSEEDAERLKKQRDEAVKQQKETTALLNEKKRGFDNDGKRFESAMKAAADKLKETKAQLEAEQKKAIEVLAKVEEMKKVFNQKVEEFEEAELKHADQIAAYEKERNELLFKIEVFKMAEESKKAAYIETPPGTTYVSSEPPAHYAPSGDGIDVIEFTQMQMTPEEVRGSVKFNITKYATRLSRKDNEVQELNKIIDYAQRYKKYLEVSQ